MAWLRSTLSANHISLISSACPKLRAVLESSKLGAVINGRRSVATVPILSEQDVLQRLRESTNAVPNSPNFLAFYSSILRGIVREPHLMVVPMDDHFVHRGHGVFDTTTVKNGKAYLLDAHLDRLIGSAEYAKIDWHAHGFTRLSMKSRILDTIKAAGRKAQIVRFYLGAGRGGYDISMHECTQPSFYCVAKTYDAAPQEWFDKGVRVVTSTVPMKAGYFARTKTTNYLPNALLRAEGNSAGGVDGVWVTEEGNVAELATQNIAFSFKEGCLTVPPFNRTLAGISVRRVMDLCPRMLGIDVEQREVGVEEAKSKSLEVFAFGGNATTVPIVQWDDRLINGGRVGEMARVLKQAQERDMVDAFGDGGVLETVGGLQ